MMMTVITSDDDDSDDDDSDDDHWMIRSCLGHSLTPCCPLAVASPRPVRLVATLGLSTVQLYTLYSPLHITLLCTLPLTGQFHSFLTTV